MKAILTLLCLATSVLAGPTLVDVSESGEKRSAEPDLVSCHERSVCDNSHPVITIDHPSAAVSSVLAFA